MDGLIVLNKPPGISSAQALGWVRRVTRQRKSGHAGTLDPLAEGVLLICLGRATKLVERLMGLPKTYETTVRLDVTNETYDLERPLIPVPGAKQANREAVAQALARFEGEIDQVPPPSSAIKIGGLAAYRRMRAGETFEMPVKRVRIDSICLTTYEWPELKFVMTCGRGTYVRSLVRDLGAALVCGGVMTHLRRSAVGPFDLVMSKSPQEIEGQEVAACGVLSLDRVESMLSESRASIISQHVLRPDFAAPRKNADNAAS
ncbi:MAG: tRNA pseudouridine(55) synthase TruB [Phycisphaerales bacterium]|nr:tRNA pseudouridine(55) synthase TruB [Phycisphaerales bacterium]